MQPIFIPPRPRVTRSWLRFSAATWLSAFRKPIIQALTFYLGRAGNSERPGVLFVSRRRIICRAHSPEVRFNFGYRPNLWFLGNADISFFMWVGCDIATMYPLNEVNKTPIQLTGLLHTELTAAPLIAALPGKISRLGSYPLRAPKFRVALNWPESSVLSYRCVLDRRLLTRRRL